MSTVPYSGYVNSPGFLLGFLYWHLEAFFLYLSLVRYGIVVMGLTYLFLELDECSSSPCQNNGTCFSDLDNYRCECPAGFTGQNCEGL